MIQYVVTEQKSGERVKYGIAAVTGRECLDRLEDVGATMQETIHLVALLQTNGVAAEHFRDVVHDYFAGATTI